MSLQVWKLGGSLFDLPDLAQRLQRLHESTGAEGPVVVIPGGGLFADAVRRLDGTHRLDPLSSHDLALEAMRLSARFVATLLGQLPVVSPTVQDEHLAHWAERPMRGLEVWDGIGTWQKQFPHLTGRFGEIPCDWSLSSDSIAAILAAFWGAQRLVLLKSVDVPSGTSPADWAAMEHVDAAFPRFAHHVAEREWVNLRSLSYSERA